jgi:hypothetical protein
VGWAPTRPESTTAMMPFMAGRRGTAMDAPFHVAVARFAVPGRPAVGNFSGSEYLGVPFQIHVSGVF